MDNTPLPMQPANDYDMARIMTSVHPPTNIRLLRNWENKTQDQDLKNLISKWIDFVDEKIDSSFDFSNEYDIVMDKFNLRPKRPNT